LELVHLQAYQWLQSQEDMNTMGHVGIEKKKYQNTFQEFLFLYLFPEILLDGGRSEKGKIRKTQPTEECQHC
jgi:hypothetical protein